MDQKIGRRFTVAEALVETGTDSPSQALKKLKETNPRYRYLPHTGAKQRAKQRRRAAKITSDGAIDV